MTDRKMHAILFDGVLKFVEDYPVPKPGMGEARIAVSMAGICNTDLEILKGYLGFRGVIGHEFVGVVEGGSEEGAHLTGKRVVGDINCGCGICCFCREGLGNHCPSRTTLGIGGRDGAFAQYLVLPLSNLHVVPAGVSDEEAVFAEPLAAALEITEQIHVKPTHSILVLGDGKLGLLCALTLPFSGAHVTLAGRHEKNLAIARSAHIDTINTSSTPDLPRVQYDIVVEATGNPQGLEMALKLTRPRGTVVLKSTVAQASAFDTAPIVINEITVIGSRCGPFEAALRTLEQGRIDVKPLISGIFTFDDARDAFKKAQDRGGLKVLVDFRKP